MKDKPKITKTRRSIHKKKRKRKWENKIYNIKHVFHVFDANKSTHHKFHRMRITIKEPKITKRDMQKATKLYEKEQNRKKRRY
jgi:hypothetical protein